MPIKSTCDKWYMRNPNHRLHRLATVSILVQPQWQWALHICINWTLKALRRFQVLLEEIVVVPQLLNQNFGRRFIRQLDLLLLSWTKPFLYLWFIVSFKLIDHFPHGDESRSIWWLTCLLVSEVSKTYLSTSKKTMPDFSSTSITSSGNLLLNPPPSLSFDNHTLQITFITFWTGGTSKAKEVWFLSATYPPPSIEAPENLAWKAKNSNFAAWLINSVEPKIEHTNLFYKIVQEIWKATKSDL